MCKLRSRPLRFTVVLFIKDTACNMTDVQLPHLVVNTDVLLLFPLNGEKKGKGIK